MVDRDREPRRYDRAGFGSSGRPGRGSDRVPGRMSGRGDDRAPRRDAPRRDGRGRDGAPRRDGVSGRDAPRREGAPRRDGSFRDRSSREGSRREEGPRHVAPEIPDEITSQYLPKPARNELKTLSKENADGVARHLAMAALHVDEDPELAHQHALEAVRRAGRIAIVREAAAITAYATGDFALAIRELRTYRRISGKDDQIPLMVDSERGVGRSDRALEAGRAVDRSSLPTAVRVHLAIAMSGAWLDLEDPERALRELDIPELDPDHAFEWSPALFAARAAVLSDLGRTEEANDWVRRAQIAERVFADASGQDEVETILVDDLDEAEDNTFRAGGDSVGSEAP